VLAGAMPMMHHHTTNNSQFAVALERAEVSAVRAEHAALWVRTALRSIKKVTDDECAKEAAKVR
jgi:hypothetical protein